MHDIDETDIAIIDVLRKNARLSTRDLAKKSGIPAATVYKRMKKLENSGVIKKYSAVLDNEKLGRNTLAYILVRTKPEADYPSMMKEITKYEGVEDIAALAGEYDIFIKVRTGSIRELDEFVLYQLRRFQEVTQTHTMIVFRQWERD
jgi:DNA-binding Lrp family transcriptional regulator